MSKTCPKCSLYNPAEATRCDCGYDFGTEQVRSSYLEAHVVQKAGGPQRFLEAQARQNIRSGALALGLGVLLTLVTYGLARQVGEGGRGPSIWAFGAMLFGGYRLVHGITLRNRAARLGEPEIPAGTVAAGTVAAGHAPQAGVFSSRKRRVVVGGLAMLLLILLVLFLPGPRPVGQLTDTSALDVSFDTAGWTLDGKNPGDLTWISTEGDVLALRRAPRPTETPRDARSARRMAREIAESHGGSLVSADLRGVQGGSAISMIHKSERGLGYDYTGMLFVMTLDEGVHLTIAAMERGRTGVRESIATVQLMKSGRLNPLRQDANGHIAGWFRDPYDAAYNLKTISSVADDEEFDVLLPSHPLSRVRRSLRALQASFAFSARSSDATVPSR